MILIIVSGCSNSEKSTEEYLSYVSSIQQWHQNRIENLKKNTLSSVGRSRLKDGENSFGSHDSNDIVFPKDRSPEFIGSFYLQNGEVTVKIDPDVEVLNKGELVREMKMTNDQGGDQTNLHLRSLRWYIMKREDEISVRLHDSESPYLDEFKGIETYPIDTAWRIKAQFEPHMQIKIIETTTASGAMRRLSSPGALGFRIKDKYFRLDVMPLNSDNFILLFGDETSGIETYDGGRFLVVEKPGERGITIMDFNKATNPPCALNKYYSCPLPTPQNILPIKVTAGEKKYQNDAH
ncbi:DUF1684 domain-containing protein [Bacteroidota bacterium]